ncbi:MAG: glycosyltransferase family 2 protein [Hydrogeniiclostridium mannosilyticum]
MRPFLQCILHAFLSGLYSFELYGEVIVHFMITPVQVKVSAWEAFSSWRQNSLFLSTALVVLVERVPAWPEVAVMLWQGCTMRDAPDFPLVSVLVASYNYEPYLGWCSEVRSVCPHFELLIIDDGSTDGSVALAESYAAKDVRTSVVRHPDGKNHGLPATLRSRP